MEHSPTSTTGTGWGAHAVARDAPGGAGGARPLPLRADRARAALPAADHFGPYGASDQMTWWQRGIIYQIYPRSFMDSNGDGTGDLPGIISRLDYLEWLGVDAIWISPIFPSPMADFGYDVSDYTSIDPLFGTLDDFDRLLADSYRRGLRVLLDYVPNHTSDRHPWFLQSRSSRDNPKRDWYLWRDPGPNGGPPNNWLSEFGGSAWTFRPADRPALWPCVPGPAAGPELAQCAGAQRRSRRDAILARARRRRLPGRCRRTPGEGRAVSRQSGQPRVSPARPAIEATAATLQCRPASGRRIDCGLAFRHRRIPEPAADRRSLFTLRPAVRLLRERAFRRAFSLQFRAAVDRVERAGDRGPGRRIRSRASSRRLAQLGSRQS